MLKPLGDRVLVKPAPKEQITKSGLIIPASAQEEKSEGEVVSLGSGLKEGKKYEFSVHVGDKVLYEKYGAEDIKIDGIDYKIMEEGKILGIL